MECTPTIRGGGQGRLLRERVPPPLHVRQGAMKLSSVCKSGVFSNPAVSIHKIDWSKVVSLASPGADGSGGNINVSSGGQVRRCATGVGTLCRTHGFR